MDSKPREILIMTIDMANMGKAKLVVHDEDEPEQLAHEFAKKFKLDQKFEKRLSAQILKQIAKLVEDNTKVPIVVGKATETVKPLYKRIQSMNDLKKTTNENFGEMLYSRGLQFKEDIESEIQRKRIETRDIDQKHLTFKPKINQSHLGTRKNSGNLEESFLTKEKERLLKLEHEKAVKYTQELKECTFRPELNKNSQIITKSRPNSADKFKILHDEAEDLRKKKQDLSSKL